MSTTKTERIAVTNFTPSERRAFMRMQGNMREAGLSKSKLPGYAFSMQKQNAKKRGVKWALTLKEWWGIWLTSGKWAERGVTTGSYVMCRTGDTGPYAVGNVFIATTADNIKEWHDAQKAKKLERGDGDKVPMVPVTFKLEEEEIDKIELEAMKLGRTRSGYVRDIVLARPKRTKSPRQPMPSSD